MSHKVAANILMLSLLILGGVSLSRINIQFLPTFDIEVINVQIAWPGAGAEDIERSIINPLEKKLRNLDCLKHINSTARQSNGMVVLEFHQGTDMSKAIETVRERVGQIQSFPSRSEKPIITRIEPYETIAKVLIYGPNELKEIREISYQFEKELFSRGIGKIEIIGLPTNEIKITLKPETLNKYKLSIPEISNIIGQASRDIPAGQVGEDTVGQNIRLLSKRRDIKSFKDIYVIRDKDGEQIKLGQIADVYQDPNDEEPKVFYKGKPAVILKLSRQANENSLKNAKIVNNWAKITQKKLGNSLTVKVFEEKWQLIKERIDTLVYNGLSGLVLIIGILYLFLDRHIAFWIVVGIPTALLASIAVLLWYGGSINMVSLFALILTLGIIVDDNIVIGEESLTYLHKGQKVGKAILKSCYKMLPAIAASSLTTIAAFFPLLLISGAMGQVLFDIPLVVICVLLASLLECFLILPGHLYHAYCRSGVQKSSQFRENFDVKFKHFQSFYFEPLLEKAIHNKGTVLSIVIALMVIAISLLKSPYLKFTFFPTPDAQQIMAQVSFLPGTPESKRLAYLNQIGQASEQAAKELKDQYGTKSLVVTKYVMSNQTTLSSYQKNKGKQYGTYYVELLGSEYRPFSNAEFIQKWKAYIKSDPMVENLSLVSPRGGPPGKDIEVSISGSSVINIKNAAFQLERVLKSKQGVYAVSDNLPFSQEQLIFNLNARGRALGLTNDQIGNQVRAAFYGDIVQTDHTPSEEVDTRVVLDQKSKDDIMTLHYLPIKTKYGRTVPLSDIIDIQYANSPEVILHEDTSLSAKVSAEVDPKLNNSNEILSDLEKNVFKKIEDKEGVQFSLKGRAEMQVETLGDMKLGLVLALSAIYIILAWVFASYRLPLLVMLAIPLGLIGAIFGHFIMGLDLTLMSLFGLFGLSGIVINDSIILVREYQLQKELGCDNIHAIKLATSYRLRAVLLTSITTIAGLTPLLFEKSRQAQFLIPMANSICFGLFFSIGLILLVLPILILLIDGKAESSLNQNLSKSEGYRINNSK